MEAKVKDSINNSQNIMKSLINTLKTTADECKAAINKQNKLITQMHNDMAISSFNL